MSSPRCSRVRHALVAPATLALLISLPGLSAAQRAEGSFDRTLTVSGAVQLDVRTGSGSINVRPGSAGSVHIIGRITANGSWFGRGPAAAEKVKRLEANPPIKQSGNAIVVGEIDDQDLRNNVSVSYEITTPAETRLLGRSGSGSQRVGDLAGPVDVSSGSGSVAIGATGGRVDASTGSGSIEAAGVKGEFHAHTGSGSVTAHQVAGAIDVETGSGGVTVSQSGPGDVRVSVGSGPVRLTGVQGGLHVSGASGSVEVSGTPTGPWDIETASGGITVTLPGSAGFDLDARTSSGSIDSKHPVTVVGTLERHELKGKVRSGGPLVRLRAASGSVRIQ